MLLAPISETPFISYLDHGQGDLEHLSWLHCSLENSLAENFEINLASSIFPGA